MQICKNKQKENLKRFWWYSKVLLFLFWGKKALIIINFETETINLGLFVLHYTWMNYSKWVFFGQKWKGLTTIVLMIHTCSCTCKHRTHWQSNPWFIRLTREFKNTVREKIKNKIKIKGFNCARDDHNTDVADSTSGKCCCFNRSPHRCLCPLADCVRS